MSKFNKESFQENTSIVVIYFEVYLNIKTFIEFCFDCRDFWELCDFLIAWIVNLFKFET